MKLIYKFETLGHVQEIFGWKNLRYVAQVYLTLLDCLVQKQSDTRDGVTCCSPLKTHGFGGFIKFFVLELFPLLFLQLLCDLRYLQIVWFLQKRELVTCSPWNKGNCIPFVILVFQNPPVIQCKVFKTPKTLMICAKRSSKTTRKTRYDYRKREANKIQDRGSRILQIGCQFPPQLPLIPLPVGSSTRNGVAAGGGSPPCGRARSSLLHTERGLEPSLWRFSIGRWREFYKKSQKTQVFFI